MQESPDDELRILRARAYGPGADIHADTRSIERLQELEAASRESIAVVRASELGPVLDPIAPEQTELVLQEVDRPEYLSARRAREGRFMKLVVAYVISVQRSTWLIIVGSVLIVSVLATALLLVQRVQTDPLQAGATQVARLSVDPAYEIPDFFGDQAGDEQRLQGFQEFHGLQVVLNLDGVVRDGLPEECIVIYAPTEITDTGDGFSGNLVSGCGAGGFPAMAQFRADLDGFPAELSAAFPGSTGLQFVYDRKNNEVVVFGSSRT